MSATPPAASVVTLHHLNNSRSQRILWLLEELGHPYDIEYHKRLPSQMAPPELKKIFPLGHAPIITDGDLVLAESGAIVEYLISKHGDGRFAAPKQGQGYVDNLYYLHYSEGSLMFYTVMALLCKMMPEQSPWLVRPLVRMIFAGMMSQFVGPELEKNVTLLETHLGKSRTGWFAGGPEPTAADFMMIFPLEMLSKLEGVTLGPNAKEYIEKVHARDAYKRGVEKGGEYAYAA